MKVYLPAFQSAFRRKACVRQWWPDQFCFEGFDLHVAWQARDNLTEGLCVPCGFLMSVEQRKLVLPMYCRTSSWADGASRLGVVDIAICLIEPPASNSAQAFVDPLSRTGRPGTPHGIFVCIDWATAAYVRSWR